MRKKTIFNVTFRIGGSHFWTLLSFCTRVFGNGRRTRFLEDECVGGKPVANQFPMLYGLEPGHLCGQDNAGKPGGSKI